jgi:hypothetical protein
MHATLAYLNAAGTRMAGSSPRNCAFMQVMDSLLANIHRVSGEKTSSQTQRSRGGTRPRRGSGNRRGTLSRARYFGALDTLSAPRASNRLAAGCVPQ